MDAESMTPRESGYYAEMANDEIRRLQKIMKRTLNQVRKQEEALRKAKRLLKKSDPFGAWMVASSISE
jgi:regulator of sirC expression with transglutaminase-like and TPR domain